MQIDSVWIMALFFIVGIFTFGAWAHFTDKIN